MNWFLENWVFVLIAIAFIALHLFGHGGHSGHGNGAQGSRRGEQTDRAGRRAQSGAHRH